MSEKEIAQELEAIAGACNLSGVVHSWGKTISALWEIAHKNGRGTEWVNMHPISKAYADKIVQLTRLDSMGACCAWEYVAEVAR